jgi:hypothetical protein
MRTPARNPWTRKGLFYYARVNVFSQHVYQGTVIKKMNFVKYHLIKKLYGEDQLCRMAMHIRIGVKR